MAIPTDVLWCANQRQGHSNRWSFPPNVERLLRERTAGKRVGHLFGGLSRWGTRLDIDATTEPHVRGDAWMAPFRRDAFDVVILDPPYGHLNQQMKRQLLREASWCAREAVYWFHTVWIAGDRSCQPARAWLIRVGDTCAVRCLIEFAVRADKLRPRPYFTRGPALKYNRWLHGQRGLPWEARA